MQSLYSFRNANVSLFASAQKNPIGPIQCTPLTLSSNFRSEEGIVNWINNCFERSFPTETNTARGAIPYSPASAVKESSSEENPVTFIGFTGSDYEHAEAKKVAQICKEKAVAWWSSYSTCCLDSRVPCNQSCCALCSQTPRGSPRSSYCSQASVSRNPTYSALEFLPGKMSP